MGNIIQITVENRMTIEKRDINIYHHARNSAHLIGSDSQMIVPLCTNRENDYMYVSLVRGAGDLNCDCIVNIPASLDFEFHSVGANVIATHTRHYTRLKIAPSPPDWHIKISRSYAKSSFFKDNAILTFEESF